MKKARVMLVTLAFFLILRVMQFYCAQHCGFVVLR